SFDVAPERNAFMPHLDTVGPRRHTFNHKVSVTLGNRDIRMISYKDVSTHPWMPGLTRQIHDTRSERRLDCCPLAPDRLRDVEQGLLSLIGDLVPVDVMQNRVAVGDVDLAPCRDDQGMGSVLAIFLINQQ